MNPKLEIAFFILLGILFLLIVFWAFSTEKRLRRFFLGKKAKDLEDVIMDLQAEIKKLDQAKNEIQDELKAVNQKLRKSIRGLELIRFNPFQDQGGNQSFAIGMLNEDEDGIVLSSLYSRERMSVFAKPVKGGKSQFELSEEEKEVLEKAKI